MANAGRKGRKPQREFISYMEPQDTPTPPVRSKAKLEPRTEAQSRYVSAIRTAKITFGVGPAGVGKTYVAARLAAEALKAGEITEIVLTRPAVESGQSIGYLPGELEEKMAPYIASYGAGFRDGFGQGHFEYLMRTGKIKVTPLNFMQGLSWDAPCMVLFDEAENATPAEMKMFLTRIGEGARVVIDGDPTQQMIKGKSGLIDGLDKVRYIRGVEIVEFKRSDIVRSGIVREILDAYEGPGEGEDEQYELPGFITGVA